MRPQAAAPPVSRPTRVWVASKLAEADGALAALAGEGGVSKLKRRLSGVEAAPGDPSPVKRLTAARAALAAMRAEEEP